MKASTSPGVIVGFEGEQNARIIYFDIESELNMWPNSVPTLLYRRPGETKVYPAETSLSGSVLMWTPDAHAMEISGGRGAVQVIFTIPGEKTVIGKSEMLPLVVKRGLGNSEDKPEPAESWIEELTDLAADTEAAAKRAEDAAIVAESAADTHGVMWFTIDHETGHLISEYTDGAEDIAEALSIEQGRLVLTL